MVRPSSIILCDLRPLRSAMKPTPQEILVERGIVKAARGRCAGIGSVAEGQMLIGAGLLRRPDIFSARPSRLHSCPVSPAQPAVSVPGSLAAS